MCHRRLDVNKSGKDSICCAHQRIFGDCVQTVRRRSRQFRNNFFGYNFSHVNRSWKCRLHCISSSVSKIHSCDCGSRCAGSPRGCTVCRQRMFLKSWRRSVKLWDRSQECCESGCAYHGITDFVTNTLMKVQHVTVSENSVHNYCVPRTVIWTWRFVLSRQT